MYTDPKRVRSDIPGTVEGNFIFVNHDAFNPGPSKVEDLKSRCCLGPVDDVEVKEKSARALNNFLPPVRQRRAHFAAQCDYIEQMIYEGTLKTQEIAQELL